MRNRKKTDFCCATIVLYVRSPDLSVANQSISLINVHELIIENKIPKFIKTRTYTEFIQYYNLACCCVWV
jgi:hypothetical protein